MQTSPNVYNNGGSTQLKQFREPPMKKERAPIWWSNAIFFVGMHAIGLAGTYYLRPITVTPWATLVLCFLSWQIASFGITIGYHRCWSHRSFTARKSLRIVLAVMGSLGFQGSIKWWCLRHRLHHRYTDDDEHDPYSASQGLLWSHMGWIFVKPNYERLALIDKEDLESDPVVRLQHKYYIPIALGFGLLAPTLIAALWGDALGGYLWGGVVARLLIWHCTFMINSLAHWEGLQLYSKEMSAKGNFFLAIMTSGEGNHNFHTFPHDFRAGYSYLDWDPSKWIIFALHRWTSLITSVKRAKDEDVREAMVYTKEHGYDHIDWEELKQRNGDQSVLHQPSGNPIPNEKEPGTAGSQKRELPVWSRDDLEKWMVKRTKEIKETKQLGRTMILLIDGFVVDVSKYANEHPGGAGLLQRYCLTGCKDKLPPRTQSGKLSCEQPSDAGEAHGKAMELDATWAFNGGLNNHSRLAKERMKSMRIARLV